jgi:hypothetical protein
MDNKSAMSSAWNEEAHNEEWIKQEHHCAKPKTIEVP